MRLACIIAVVAALCGCFGEPRIVFSAPEGEGGAGAGGAGSAGGGGDGGQGTLAVCTEEVGPPCATIQRIWAGGTFSCAGLDDDTVRCFGLHDSGQLGDPDVPASLFETEVTVRGVSASADIVLGYRHGCAVQAGALLCWGRNTMGQLGTGDLTFRNEPTTNLLVAPTDAVSTYSAATCARTAGSVFCWGLDINGQGWVAQDDGERQLSPALVSGLDGVVDLGVGTVSACALKGDGSLWCWGYGNDGQLGQASLESSASPVQVATSLEQPVHHMAHGGAHVCVLAGSPAVVQCWGSLPSLTAVTSSPTTLASQPSGVVIDLQSGSRYSCALLDDGRVQCWGQNARGQLGTGAPATEVPSNVATLTDAVQIALGREHACALRAGGEMLCWGDNRYGQLGTTPSPGVGTPQTVPWNLPSTR